MQSGCAKEMDSGKTKKTNVNLDLIRTCALFLVISVHFFRYVGFNSERLTYSRMFVMINFRNFSMACIPLFLLLSGYLCGHFVFDKKHLMRVVNLILVYIACGVICMIFSVYRFDAVPTLEDGVRSFLLFDAAPYAWYVEMYLALMLLIPFLNRLYRSLGKGYKQLLVLCCLIATSLSTVVPNWPVMDYWYVCYPVTVYFLGLYLRDEPLKMKKRVALPAMLGVCLFNSTISWFLDKGKKFTWLPFNEHGSIYMIAIAVLLFQFLLQIDLENLPTGLQRLIRSCAGCTLPAYLLSYCFDEFFYPIVFRDIPVVSDRYLYWFVLVPVIFVCSLVGGWCVTKLTKCLTGLIEKPIMRIKWKPFWTEGK